jgi:hypothetical protein
MAFLRYSGSKMVCGGRGSETYFETCFSFSNLSDVNPLKVTVN